MPLPGLGFTEVEVVFVVEAETFPGCEVRVVGNVTELGEWHPEGGLALRTDADVYPRWSGSARIPPSGQSGNGSLEYKYVIVKPNEETIWESGENRGLVVPHGIAFVHAERDNVPSFGDSFDLSPTKSVLHSTASSTASTALTATAEASVDSSEVEWVVNCPITEPGDSLVIVGSNEALGHWQPCRGLRLSTGPSLFPEWHGSAVLLANRELALEWKVAVLRADGSTEWEPVMNRSTMLSGHAKRDDVLVIRATFGGTCHASTDSPNRSLPGQALSGSSSGASSTSKSPSHQRFSAPGTVHHEALRERLASQFRRKFTGEIETQPSRSRNNSKGDAMGTEADLDQWSLLSRRTSTADLDGHDQLIMLRWPAAPEHGQAEEAVHDIDAQVVFEANEIATHKLRYDDMQELWVIGCREASLPVGIHMFHFLVDGMRVLSSLHPVIGDSNAALFSDSLRRYVRNFESHKALDSSSSRPASPTQPTRTPDKLSELPDLKTPKTASKGSLNKAWSISNVCALVDDGNAAVATQATNLRSGQLVFARETFEGLFDRELRLRLDGHVLPPEGSPSSPSLSRKPARWLWSASHQLKKIRGSCEDACFTGPHALGVADGVGCMVQFASYGINAAAFAAELMEHAEAALQPNGPASEGLVEERAVAALAAAADRTAAYGASTICVLSMEDSTIGVANLGDSGFMVLRKGPRGMTVVDRSTEMQHSWNCPYQLTHLPSALSERFPTLHLDSAADCDTYRVNVCEGDLILVYTDGLRDNLHDREILHIADCALTPSFGALAGVADYVTPPERLAKALATAAQERSLDPSAKVPFAEHSRRLGYEIAGGKQDDITVIAAWVVSATFYCKADRCDDDPSRQLTVRPAG
eukprot:gnl/TRDRNA2_/TRDRNA2_185507_c0_seq1.p1 gnl/TRDRNA2_/TRDRNA2_185507_c0~~gnl/TRDRNA2_/TRDRNA2_185507_c0_seq1.p1  ORF type:complete len:874 (+),score=123.61 gnl/TRDRNA2_/TRDRNA2_185507_c0_seq1:79-2700(+)